MAESRQGVVRFDYVGTTRSLGEYYLPTLGRTLRDSLYVETMYLATVEPSSLAVARRLA